MTVWTMPKEIRVRAAAVLLFVWPWTCLPASAQPAPPAWPAVRAELVVDAAWLAAHRADRDVVVLHVGRDKTAFDKGHVCGAQFVALADIAVTKDGVPNEMPPTEDLRQVFERAGVGDGTRVILYGDRQGLFAARAFVALDYLGHADRAALLDGGLEHWKTEQRPTCTESATPTPGTLTVRPRPQIVATMAEVAKAVAGEAGETLLIDARPPREFRGEEPGENVTRPGHIPGARNVYWIETVESEAHPVLKPADEVRKIYEAAGVVPGRPVLTYCRTGVQASHAYFTLKWLGLEPRLYDGSYLEWSSAKDTEVERDAPPPVR
jgi:thiosulfate/3-mercaptopyruvate sulfurtransferase